MKRTMFERYGGFASVSRIVTSFYDKIVESPVTAPYFDGVDMRKLIDHQTKFIASLMGGPASYSNDQLERIHSNLGINEPAFFEAVELLKESLEDHDVEPQDIQFVADALMARKNFIVSRA